MRKRRLRIACESDKRNEAIAAPRPTSRSGTSCACVADGRAGGARRRPVAESSSPVPAAAPPPVRRATARQAFGRAPTSSRIKWRQAASRRSKSWRRIRRRAGGSARHGSIERSGNGGATWTASPAASPKISTRRRNRRVVCWVVGRRDTVQLSVDGLQWRRVAFPDNTDLATVQASDASSATVTTADNRRFRTADGGQTWTPLQEF